MTCGAAALSLLVGLAGASEARPDPPRTFQAMLLEPGAETSANPSMGALDADGDLDLVLAKGRHWPLHNRVLINDGRGAFVARDLDVAADRTYSGVLADRDGDGFPDIAAGRSDAPNVVYFSRFMDGQ